MTTAVDTSVLLAICKGQPDGDAWLRFLPDQRKQGPLIVCEVVVAEISAFFPGATEALAFLANLGVQYDPVHWETAILAGRIFRAYRQAGGPREHLIPDFLIGAHATQQADQLASGDRGYIRTYFPRLKVLGLP